MMANNFYKPLLDEDCMDREINAIESEFKMNSSDDVVRMLQILQGQAKDADDSTKHLFNRFMWGNKKSLREAGNETLWQDLRQFF